MNSIPKNNRYLKISLFVSIGLFFAFLSPPPVSADVVSDVWQAFGTNNPFKYTEIGPLITNGLTMGLMVASILVLLYLVWGGIQWATSGGDKASLEAARGRITAAIMGLAIVAVAWAIFLIIKTFFGLPISTTG